MFKNKKLEISLSIIFKATVIIACLAGVVAGSLSDSFMSKKQFLYFTVQSNICIALICFVFLIFDIIKIRNINFEIPNCMYYIKFMCTVSIILTFLVFSVILTPSLLIAGDGWYLSTVENICLHNISPIFAILDFCFFNNKFKTSKTTFIWGLVMPFCYFISTIAFILGNTDFGDGATAPYFFLDYKTNSWFNIEGGQFGTFYWIIIVSGLVLGISMLLVWIKNLIYRKLEKKGISD